MSTGTTRVIALFTRMISSAKTVPAMGALKMAATPAAVPLASNSNRQHRSGASVRHRYQWQHR